MPKPLDSLPFVAMLVLFCLCFCGLWSMWLALDHERRDHSGITVERALVIMRDSKDENLRDGARVALDKAFQRAIELLRQDQSEQTKLLLLHWQHLLK